MLLDVIVIYSFELDGHTLDQIGAMMDSVIIRLSLPVMHTFVTLSSYAKPYINDKPPVTITVMERDCLGSYLGIITVVQTTL